MSWRVVDRRGTVGAVGNAVGVLVVLRIRRRRIVRGDGGGVARHGLCRLFHHVGRVFVAIVPMGFDQALTRLLSSVSSIEGSIGSMKGLSCIGVTSIPAACSAAIQRLNRARVE